MDGEDNITLSEGRGPTSSGLCVTVSEGACRKANSTHRKFTRRSMQDYAGVPSRENEGYWLAVESDRGVGPDTVHASGRRLSESRMRANLTSSSMWQGMETRTCPRRHPLTLPANPYNAGLLVYPGPGFGKNDRNSMSGPLNSIGSPLSILQ